MSITSNLYCGKIVLLNGPFQPSRRRRKRCPMVGLDLLTMLVEKSSQLRDTHLMRSVCVDVGVQTLWMIMQKLLDFGHCNAGVVVKWTEEMWSDNMVIRVDRLIFLCQGYSYANCHGHDLLNATCQLLKIHSKLQKQRLSLDFEFVATIENTWIANLALQFPIH